MKHLLKKLWKSGAIPLVLFFSIVIILFVLYHILVGLSNINIPLLAIMGFIIGILIIFFAKIY